MIPTVGSHFIIKSQYIEFNSTVVDAIPLIKQGVEFEVLHVEMIYEGDLSAWGITAIKHVETGTVIDINEYRNLSEYWCLFTDGDDIKFIG